LKVSESTENVKPLEIERNDKKAANMQM